jgi:multisubunit Na+/H+ antiporter MnhC subunit
MSAIVTAAVIGAALLVVALVVEVRERRGIGKGQAL